MAFDATAPFSKITRAIWRQLISAALAPRERLFFEGYAYARWGRPYALPVLDGVADSRVDPVATHLGARGVPADAARSEARLRLAVERGLLLDLLATGDRVGVEAALERHIEAFGSRYPNRLTA
jgi:hypothetical protein